MREVSRQAAEVALELATPRHAMITNGKRDAVWRLREDGLVEVARASWGRVELVEVSDDGTSQVVATSPRSGRKALGHGLVLVAGGLLVLGVVGGLAGIHAGFGLVGVAFLAMLLAFVFDAGSDVRRYVRERYGSDEDWAHVPWAIEGEPTTANQAVALTQLARVRFRVAEDGSIDAVRRGKLVEVLRIERDGTVVLLERVPRRQFKRDLAGWHRVVERDPTD